MPAMLLRIYKVVQTLHVAIQRCTGRASDNLCRKSHGMYKPEYPQISCVCKFPFALKLQLAKIPPKAHEKMRVQRFGSGFQHLLAL